MEEVGEVNADHFGGNACVRVGHSTMKKWSSVNERINRVEPEREEREEPDVQVRIR